MLIKPSPSTRDNIGGSIIKLAHNEQDHVDIIIYSREKTISSTLTGILKVKIIRLLQNYKYVY